MSVFKFKKFQVIQEKSAMKVGTDGVLLGSWAFYESPKQILDIGCGTGLIVLMLAQRYSKSKIVGIDIDEISSREAHKNIRISNWKDRISIINTSLQQFKTDIKFDLIVSNPPFFPANKSLKRRDVARHSNCLSFEELIQHAIGLLSKNGTLAFIIPKNFETTFIQISEENNLFCNRICYVKGNDLSEIKRVMVQFSLTKSKMVKDYLVIEKSRHQYTDQYIDLCKNFYIDM